MQKKGFSQHYAYLMFKKSLDGLTTNQGVSLRKKIWALRRGFISDKVIKFGLTEENYQDYISDFAYYKLHPINQYFSIWIDDKLTLKFILHPFNENLPEYYFHIRNGEILPLLEAPKETPYTTSSIIHLLEEKNSLTIKLVTGSKGEGFIKLHNRDGRYFFNKEEFTVKELSEKLDNLIKQPGFGYLITEYIKPCRELSEIWSKSPNTIRLSVFKLDDGFPHIVFAYIRFGTEQTGYVDNASVGAITCRIDVETGRFSEGEFHDGLIYYKHKFHPDSGELLEGTIPRWNEIKEKIVKICSYLPQLIYLGIDLIVTDEGFKIIEINSHEGIVFNQRSYPYLKFEPTKTFFSKLLK
jgi:hypothetical protein